MYTGSGIFVEIVDLRFWTQQSASYLQIYHPRRNKFCTPFQFSPAPYLIIKDRFEIIFRIQSRMIF